MDEKGYQANIAALSQRIEQLERDIEKRVLLRETAGIPILMIRGFVFVDCNSMAEEVFGLPKEQIIGKEPFILSPKYQPDGVSSEEKAIQLIEELAHGEHRNFDWVHLRGDNSRFYVDIQLNKIVVDNEALVQVIFRDISKQRLDTERLENQNKIIRHLNKKYQRQNVAYEKLVEQIQKQQELNNTILSAINDGVAVFSRENIIYINKQMQYMAGIYSDSPTPKSLFEALGLNFAQIDFPTRGTRQLDVWPSGRNTQRYFRMQIIAIADTNDYLAHLTDYTAIKKAHSAIEESEYKFRSIFHSSTDGIIVVDQSLGIKEVNETFESRYGYVHTDLMGVRVDTLFHNPTVGAFTTWMSENADEQLKLTEFDALSATGAVFPVEIGCRRIELGATGVFLVIVRDISFRKSFEQRLLHRTIETEEKERKRIAANLHDELGPVLSSLKLYNNILKGKKEEQLQFLSNNFDELITEAVETVRLLSEDLSPVSLYKGGLERAIERRIKALNSFFEIHFESTLQSTRFSEQIEINTYRIVNELVNNTMKHARATVINIKLIKAKSTLYIHYSDNGIGLKNPTEAEKDDGRGVGNILGRLKSMQAGYRIISQPGDGVRYDIDIPIV
ncbi:MAG: PAS domain S-box protein [Salinivirgaceae bacterium]|jgi:PAS domain S-box-containing protein|nr:PAS domain S-box protein [Salinivirgaceae bacterium]